MKFRYTALIGRVVGLVVVTIFALIVMLASGTKVFQGEPEPQLEQAVELQPTTRAAVAIRPLEKETIDIVENYTGIIEPYERYRTSFEIGGRLESLGVLEVELEGRASTYAQGKTLDVGDRVLEGQVLAALDRRALLARKQETQARREEAESDMERKRALAERTPGLVTEEEMQGFITELEVARAQDALAEKNLEDAVLLSPCDGVITSREVTAGESVNPNQLVFEILEVDRLRLVVEVPQSRLHYLTELSRASDGGLPQNQQGIQADRLQADASWKANGTLPDPSEATFPTTVELLQQRRAGDTPQTVEGFVYRVSEDDDQNTGLFPVEILLNNENHTLRPGQLARASILVDQIVGHRVPMATALHRNGKSYVFTVLGEQDDVEFMFWDIGEGTSYTAQMIELTDWIEQGTDLILPDMTQDYNNIVVRGQHRLVDQRPVRLVPEVEAPQGPQAEQSQELIGSAESLSQ